MSKEAILDRIRRNTLKRYDMPVLDSLHPLTYPDTLGRFIEAVIQSGSRIISLENGSTVNDILRREFPENARISSNLPGVEANINPDVTTSPAALDGIDAAVVQGTLGVAENGCIWIPQTMTNRAEMFIAKTLVIILPANSVVNNMHEAYKRVKVSEKGYGAFISGPSKTADIAQVLVMGAQAARDVLIILT